MLDLHVLRETCRINSVAFVVATEKEQDNKW